LRREYAGGRQTEGTGEGEKKDQYAMQEHTGNGGEGKDQRWFLVVYSEVWGR